MSTESTPAAGFKPKKSVALSGVTAGNTALCTVGRSGNDLHYRGYDILDLAENCEFEEVAHLLIHGKLPTAAELKGYKTKLKRLRGLPATVLDALENLHRMDKDFLRELLAKHKSGLEILAGSEQFERPGAQDAGAVEELFRVLGKSHDYVVVDAGNQVNSCSIAALYAADSIFLVANPDVPSVRNAQRLVDKVRQLGVGGERIRILLNRASDQHMIGQKQIETALGYGIHHTFPSDYKTVSTALNSGVPLSLTNHSEIAEQFGSFTRHIIAPGEVADKAAVEKRRAAFSFSFLS